MNAASDFSRLKSPHANLRRRPALPSGYEPPDYRVVQVRLADGTILHVNADDLADPRYVNVRNLSPDGVPVPGRAGLQPRAVFHGAEVLGSPYYGTEYQPGQPSFKEHDARRVEPDFKEVEPGDVVEKLFQQAQRAGVHLTPAAAEGLSLGDPRVIGYVAEMIAQMGGKPAVEPRQDGGSTVPGKNYVVNEVARENFRDSDGQVRPVGDGRPALVQAQRPGVILPNQTVDMPWQSPHWDITPTQPGSLAGPMPVMPKVNRGVPVDEQLGVIVPVRPAWPRGRAEGAPQNDLGTMTAVQRAKVDNALLALENTRFGGSVPGLRQMVENGNIRVDPELQKHTDTKKGQTSIGGVAIYQNPEIFERLDEDPTGFPIAGVAGNLAHEYEHVKQWGNPLRKAYLGLQDLVGYDEKKASNGDIWGPMEWEPHQLGDEAEKAVMNDYRKNFIRGDRRFPLDPYFYRQGMSTPQELRQRH